MFFIEVDWRKKLSMKSSIRRNSRQSKWCIHLTTVLTYVGWAGWSKLVQYINKSSISFLCSKQFCFLPPSNSPCLWHLFESLRGPAPLLSFSSLNADKWELGDYFEIHSEWMFREKSGCGQLMHWILSSLEHNWFGSIFSLPGRH